LDEVKEARLKAYQFVHLIFSFRLLFKSNNEII